MDRSRSLLAEDHPGVAEQLRGLLEAEFDVVATVSDGRALLTAEDKIRPDVVVTDIMMPGLDGITATPALLARRPATRVAPGMVYHGPLVGEVWLRGRRPRLLVAAHPRRRTAAGRS